MRELMKIYETWDRIAFRDEMKKRTKRFAVQCVKFYQGLPNNQETWVIGKQFLRSATSIAANYRAACRARFGSEFLVNFALLSKRMMKHCFGWNCLKKRELLIKKQSVQSM